VEAHGDRPRKSRNGTGQGGERWASFRRIICPPVRAEPDSPCRFSVAARADARHPGGAPNIDAWPTTAARGCRRYAVVRCDGSVPEGKAARQVTSVSTWRPSARMLLTTNSEEPYSGSGGPSAESGHGVRVRGGGSVAGSSERPVVPCHLTRRQHGSQVD
jgi:hypothetical protein